MVKRYGGAAALAFLAAAAWAAPAREVFDNGLVAIVAEDHARPVAAVRVYVKVGAVYEGEHLGAGVSHYIEHLLGDRTEKHTKAEMEAAMAALGGANNAYTSKSHVCYHVACRADKVNDAIALLEERVFHAVFAPEDVATQRDIILNEIRMGQDDPSRRLWYAFYATAFREHPARYPVIGYAELFRQTTREELEAFYRRYYTPERTVVVVAGDVDAAATMAQLRAAFGALPRGRAFPEPVFSEPPQEGPRTVVVPMDIGAAYMWLGFRGAPYGSRDDYALDVLAAVAGGGRSSRLYRRVLEEGGYVTNIGAWNASDATNANATVVSAEGEAIELNYAEDAIIAEMLRFAEKPPSAEELARAKKTIAAGRVLAREDVEGVASDLGENEILNGNMNYGDEYLRRINEVTAADVRAAARTYIRADRMTVVKVVPRDWAAGGTAAAPPVAVGPLTMTTLPNGLRLVIRRNPALPAVAVRTIIGGGARVVAPGVEGTAELAAELMLRGTRRRSADRIAREAEDLGATLGTDAYPDYTTLDADCLAEDLPKVFELVADCLANSVIPGAEFERERDRLLSAVQSEDDDPEIYAEKQLREHLYPHHPYRYLTSGTVASLQNITREEVAAYYEKYVTPTNVVVAVAGDVDPAAVTALATKRLGGWRPPAAPAPVIPQDAPPTGRERVDVATDNEQAIVYYGFWGITYGNADEFALRVLDAAASGVTYPSGRLHNRLRGEGLVYMVHAYNVVGADPGFFGVVAATAPATAERVVAVIDEEIEKLKTTPLSPAELALAQENCRTMNALYNAQTNGDVGALAARDELIGLGYRWRDDFDARIAAVTAEDVMNAARKYLVNPVVVVASPGAAAVEEGKTP